MSDKKRFLLFLVLAMIASGAVFFALGLAMASRFGFVENKVVVDTLSSEVASVTTTVFQERIDLNTATVEALMQIDGIGEKTAQNIIAYRESIGGFTFVEQLLYVDGIGETKYNKWSPYLTVVTTVDTAGNTSSSAPTTTKVNETAASTSVVTTTATPTTAATKTTGTLATTTVSTRVTTSTTTTAFAGRIELNTATVEELMLIDGIGEKTAQRIVDYRDRIGGFTAMEQLLDIEGIGETKFKNWSGYLTLNGVVYTGTITTATTAKVTSITTAAEFQGTIDLNMATAEELMQINGIGEKTAKNILAYRDRIGGFTCVEQLLDVDGIGETKFNSWCAYFTVNGVGYSGTTSAAVTTVPTTTMAMTERYNLNLVTHEELMTIRGIGEKIAASIIHYREEIGGFTDMEQLMEIDGIGESRYVTLCEYVTLEDE